MESTKIKPTLDELTAEQKARRDAEYVAAVNRGLEKAIDQAERGETVPAERAWKDLGLGN